jgi:hypothetical protein
MRSAWFLGAFAVGLVLVVVLALKHTPLAHTPVAAPDAAAVRLTAPQTLCQGPLQPGADARFDRVRVFVGAGSGALDLTVRDADGRVLGRGRTPAVGPDARGPVAVSVPVGELRTPDAFSICLQVAAELWGAAGSASPATEARVNGVPATYDVAVWLERSPAPRFISQLGTVADRASRFKAGWVTPGVLAVLALAVLVGLPALVLTALRHAD